MSPPVRLAADFVRRTPGLWIVVPFTMVIWMPALALMPSSGINQLSIAAAISQTIVGLGAFVGLFSFSPRAMHYLPVSRRQTWQAQWLFCVIVFPLIVALGKIAAFVVAFVVIGMNSPGADWSRAAHAVLLSSLCDVAYGGSFPGVLWLMRLLVRRVRLTPVPMIAFAVGLVWFGGCWYWGFLWRESIPLQMAGLTGMPGVVLGMALTLGLAARWHEPPASARDSFRAMPPNRHRARSERRPLVTGIPALVLREVRLNLALTFVVLASMSVARSVFFERGALGDVIALTTPGLTVFLGGVVPFPAFFFVVLASARNGLQTVVRQMRTLPLSARYLNLVFLLTPAVYLLAIAFVLVAARFATTGQSFLAAEIPIFLVSLGLATLGQSIQLRRRVAFSMDVVVLALVAGVAGWALQIWPQTRGLVSPAAFGLVMLAAAAMLNHRWLTRSTMTYRGAPLEFVLSE